MRHCVRDQVGTCPCERPWKVDGEHPDPELSRVGAAGVININDEKCRTYDINDKVCKTNDQ